MYRFNSIACLKAIVGIEFNINYNDFNIVNVFRNRDNDLFGNLPVCAELAVT